ncbi:hypothetical protein [Saccharopolyspora sp. NPDC002376]
MQIAADPHQIRVQRTSVAQQRRQSDHRRVLRSAALAQQGDDSGSSGDPRHGGQTSQRRKSFCEKRKSAAEQHQRGHHCDVQAASTVKAGTPSRLVLQAMNAPELVERPSRDGGPLVASNRDPITDTASWWAGR